MIYSLIFGLIYYTRVPLLFCWIILLCFLILFLVHVSVLVFGNRYATGLAVADFLVPYAQVHAKNLLLASVRVWHSCINPYTVFNNIQSRAHWNYALLQGVSVDNLCSIILSLAIILSVFYFHHLASDLFHQLSLPPSRHLLIHCLLFHLPFLNMHSLDITNILALWWPRILNRNKAKN